VGQVAQGADAAERHDEHEAERSTPPAVIAAIAVGVAPLPFLAVYAVLFLVHGFVVPVQPPDITGSRRGEAVAGIVALLLFIVGVVGIHWFVSGQRRWLFFVGQVAALGTAIDFLADPSTGSAAVPGLLAVTSAAALALSVTPTAARHVGAAPGLGRRGRKSR
jgi:hypothetical protein